jgi:hypothetical protein
LILLSVQFRKNISQHFLTGKQREGAPVYLVHNKTCHSEKSHTTNHFHK